MSKKIATSALHDIPSDIEDVLLANDAVLEKWNNLTPLAWNEWICWVTIVKKQETREKHLIRLQEDILNSKKRPCCWPGCPHRRESAKKWFKTLMNKID